MRRTIRLTERDLTRLVRRVINESKSYSMKYSGTNGVTIETLCAANSNLETNGTNSVTVNGKTLVMTPDMVGVFCTGVRQTTPNPQ